MQVNHTMTQLMTERETLRAEVERQDREIERLRAALQKIESEVYGLGMSRQIARAALEGK